MSARERRPGGGRSVDAGPGSGTCPADRGTSAAPLPSTAGGPVWSTTWAALLLTALAVSAAAQAPPTGGAAAPDPLPLFATTALLDVTLTADLAALDGDRAESPDRPATLTVEGAGGEPVEVALEVRTRGNFRLETCAFPPLRMDVDGDGAAGTAFEGQDDLKLVASCSPGRDSFEELVVKEYLVYRSIQAVTDASFRVRRLRMTFADVDGASPPVTRAAFVIEDDEALGRRLGATVYELEEGMNLPASAFEPVMRMTNAVAQYMVGNPDWSDVAGHNVELLDRGGVALAVPYDFDFSGLVDAPYATPPPEYRLDSVRERYYRGWCESPLTTREVLRRFRGARAAILDLWRTEPGLSEGERERSIRYLEEFFDAVETDERAEGRFLRDCRTPS